MAKFSQNWQRYTRQHKVPDHQLKITFQHSDFVRKALFICNKRQPPLPCQSINFIIFLFILHHKCQNNVPEPKTSYQQPLCKFESDFRFVQFFFIHPVLFLFVFQIRHQIFKNFDRRKFKIFKKDCENTAILITPCYQQRALKQKALLLAHVNGRERPYFHISDLFIV